MGIRTVRKREERVSAEAAAAEVEKGGAA